MSNTIAVIGIRGYPPTFPGAGGIDVYVQRILPQLRRKNTRVLLFTRSWAKPVSKQKLKNVSVRKIPTIRTKHLDTPVYAILASILVCATKANIVWFHAPGSAILSFLPKLCGKRTHLTLHGIDWQREKWGPVARVVLRCAEWLSVKTADRLFVVSKELSDYVKHQYRKVPEVKAVELFRRKKVRPKRIKERYGLEGADYILYLGRFVPEKRIEWLIRAFLDSKKIDSSVKLVLAGKIEGDRYGRELNNVTKSKNTIIWAGFVTGQIKSELLSNCLIFVLPSSLEGYSLALAEAMSYRRNCLVSDLKIHRELAGTSRMISVFKKDAFEDFRKKLEKLATTNG